jgi:hypothetical protein
MRFLSVALLSPPVDWGFGCRDPGKLRLLFNIVFNFAAPVSVPFTTRDTLVVDRAMFILSSVSPFRGQNRAQYL